MSFNPHDVPKPTVPDPRKGSEGELLSPHNRGLGMPPSWTGGGGGGGGGDYIGVAVLFYLIGGLIALFGLAKECAQEKPSQTSRQVQVRRGTASSTQIPNLILWNDHKNNFPKCEGTYTNRGKIVWFANGTCDVEPDKDAISLSGHSNQFEMCTFTGRKRTSGDNSLYATGNLCCGARLSELSSCDSVDVPLETREAINYGRVARPRHSPPPPPRNRCSPPNDRCAPWAKIIVDEQTTDGSPISSGGTLTLYTCCSEDHIHAYFNLQGVWEYTDYQQKVHRLELSGGYSPDAKMPNQAHFNLGTPSNQCTYGRSRHPISDEGHQFEGTIDLRTGNLIFPWHHHWCLPPDTGVEGYAKTIRSRTVPATE